MIIQLILFLPVAFAQQKVSGYVTDSSNGERLPGVNVIVKGSTAGTITDMNGNYVLEVAGAESVLVFSFIGYATQELSVNGRSSISITMAPDTQTLQEVIVVGYGEKKKATITGAVTSVKNEDILKSPVTNLSNALVGRLPLSLHVSCSCTRVVNDLVNGGNATHLRRERLRRSATFATRLSRRPDRLRACAGAHRAGGPNDQTARR